MNVSLGLLACLVAVTYCYSPPSRCGNRGCVGPRSGPRCKNEKISYPNGKRCAPTCRVCLDPPTTTVKPRKICTKRGCVGPRSGPRCKNEKISYPNGKGCAPTCRVCLDPPITPVKKLACPSYPVWFNVELTEPLCKSDFTCQDGEKCCPWGRGKQCKKGLDITPKEGTCPASSGGSPMGCLMDYGGCQYDSECTGSKKCCNNSACGYKDCREVVPRCTKLGCPPKPGKYCRKVKRVRPNGKGCRPVCKVCADKPKKCTKLGCPPKPGKYCRKVKRVRPNGKGCRPVCKVCADKTKKCTKRGCPPKPGKYCRRVKRVRPNGKGCRPVCKVCADKPKVHYKRPYY